MSNSPAKFVKDIIFVRENTSFELFQSFYLDETRKNLRSNIALINEKTHKIIFEVNKAGLKGKEIDPGKKTAVIWGDSVVFGVNNGWVDQINGTFENYQFLNGGIEGDSPDNIVNRAIKKNNELDIELNILFPGWHQLEDYDLFVDSMGQAVKHLENLVLCTVPFALSPALASQDISAHFNEFDLKVLELEEGTNECFLFWGTLPYSIENAEMITRNITERNHIIREFAQKLHIPLIDLAEKFHNEDITKLTEVFFDVGHPRPSAYPLFAEAIKEGLTDVIK